MLTAWHHCEIISQFWFNHVVTQLYSPTCNLLCQEPTKRRRFFQITHKNNGRHDERFILLNRYLGPFKHIVDCIVGPLGDDHCILRVARTIDR